MAQRLFSNFESFTHAVLKLPEKHCCYLAFSYCLHGLEKKMSFLERKLVLPVPIWRRRGPTPATGFKLWNRPDPPSPGEKLKCSLPAGAIHSPLLFPGSSSGRPAASVSLTRSHFCLFMSLEDVYMFWTLSMAFPLNLLWVSCRWNILHMDLLPNWPKPTMVLAKHLILVQKYMTVSTWKDAQYR